MKILTSSKYSRFDTITGNRNISKSKVEKLIEDIESGLNLLPYCPIVVYKADDKLKIIDGQHRFEASKALKKEIHYVVCEKLNLKQIAKLNSRSDKWKQKDFLNCYIELGSEDYKTLGWFLDKYHLVYSAAIDFLMFGKLDPNKKGMDLFRDGEFKVNHLEATENLVKLTWEIFDRYNFRSDRYLLKAVQILLENEKCDFDHLKNKISEAPMEMNQNENWKDYIYNIEKVYNYRCSNRTVIF